MTLALVRAVRSVDPLRSYTEEPPGFGGMSGPQRDFHADPSRLRFFRAAGGVGKSVGGGAEFWFWGLGRHPFRKTGPAGGEFWALCDDLKQGWKSISKALRLLEPPGVLHSSCRYIDGIGYTYRSQKILQLASHVGGALLVGKGGSQSVLSMEGDRIRGLWIDEPPKPAHYGGCRSRVDRTGGPVWGTLTPIGRPCTWLRNKIEGDPEKGTPPEEPGWAKWQVELTAENAPHLSPQQLAAMEAGCDPHERPQRLRAEWEGYSQGRRFVDFHEGLIFDDEEMPTEVDEVRVSFDFGEMVKSQIGHIQAIIGRRYWMLAEIVPGGTTPIDLAVATIIALVRLGLSVHHITRVIGDVNTAGMLGGGAKYSHFLERAFAEVLRNPGLHLPAEVAACIQPLTDCPFSIEIPAKRNGSVAAGESAMNTAMREGRYFFHRSCTRFIKSARHYTGRELDLKHPIDSPRYGLLDKLLADHPTLPTTVRIR